MLSLILARVDAAYLAEAGPGRRALEDARSKKYADLISQLVSPNKEPITGDESVRFPAGYDVKAQQRVEAARQALYDNFEDALPYLVEALNDTRYSMTVDWADGDAYPNYSVGKTCRHIIASQLEIYRDKIKFSGPQHWHRYDYAPISKEWRQKRKGRSLRSSRSRRSIGQSDGAKPILKRKASRRMNSRSCRNFAIGSPSPERQLNPRECFPWLRGISRDFSGRHRQRSGCHGSYPTGDPFVPDDGRSRVRL